MKRHNLPFGLLALEGGSKRREVPAYVCDKLHVHYAGHDWTLNSAVVLPLGEIGSAILRGVVVPKLLSLVPK